MAVVVEDLVMCDRPRDEPAHEPLELRRVHRLGVVLDDAEQLLTAHEQRQRVLVADVHDARPALRRRGDALVLERAEDRDGAGVGEDSARDVALDREEARHVVRRRRPDVVGEGRPGDEVALPVLETEEAVAALRRVAVVLRRDGDALRQRHVVRTERARERAEVDVAQLDRQCAIRRRFDDAHPLALEELAIVVDGRGRGRRGVHGEPGLEMAPHRVRRVVAAHEVAVQEHIALRQARRRDAPPHDRRRRRQHELDRVLHRLGRVVDEHVHRARADVDGEDALVAPVVAQRHRIVVLAFAP